MIYALLIAYLLVGFISASLIGMWLARCGEAED